MSNVIQKIKSKAEKLAELRASIHRLEEKQAQELDPLKVERDAVQQELLEELKKNELASIKTENGETYARSSRKSLEITNDIFALSWAKENHCFSVNKLVAMQRIAKLDKIPDGFNVVENEFISIRKPKEKEE